MLIAFGALFAAKPARSVSEIIEKSIENGREQLRTARNRSDKRTRFDNRGKKSKKQKPRRAFASLINARAAARLRNRLGPFGRRLRFSHLENDSRWVPF